MDCVLLDGSALAARLRADLKEKVKSLRDETGTICRLAVILVGDDPASKIYVQRKTEACDQVGIESDLVHLFPQGVEREESAIRAAQQHVVRIVESLANDTSIHGILVQLPVGPLDKASIIDAIPPCKDVDCFTPHNVGLLAQDRAILKPCTPAGILRLLMDSQITLEGKRATIINNSDIVGKPLALMLTHLGVTVTVCHHRTPPDTLATCTHEADIVVVAVGKPDFLNAGMIKPGAVVVDVGINRVNGKVVGDVDPRFGFRERAGYLTPVPGGVGPMTVAMLLENTYTAARKKARR